MGKLRKRGKEEKMDKMKERIEQTRNERRKGNEVIEEMWEAKGMKVEGK